jgi:hypothetical protein
MMLMSIRVAAIASAFVLLNCGSSASENKDGLAGSMFEQPLPTLTGLATVNAAGLHVDLSNRELVCGKFQDPNTEGLINIGINAPSPDVAPGTHSIAATVGPSTFEVSGLSVTKNAEGRVEPQQVIATSGTVEVLRNDDTTFSARVTTTDRYLKVSGVFSAKKCAPH